MEDTTQPRNSPGLDAASIFLLLITIFVFLLPLFLYFPPVLPSRTDAILQTHSRVGVEPGSSDPKSRGNRSPKDAGARGSGSGSGRIKSLWIYPIKSCKGIELNQSKVVPAGLEFDRLFTFAQLKSPFPVRLDTPDAEKSGHRWEFITQRQFRLLATIQVELYIPDIIKHKGQPFKTSDVFIVLRFPWRERGIWGVLGWLAVKLARGWRGVPGKEIILPATFPSASEIEENGYTYDEVTIWKETVTALNMGSELPEELQLYLGVSNKLALFRIDPERLREVFRCAPREEEAGYQPVTGFQDAYPLHLLNVSSVADLEEKVPKDEKLKKLDPRRFRANIIIDGVEPYEEETWKQVRFKPTRLSRREESTYHVSCRTVRCKMPNVNPDDGHRHPVEPDKSLRKFREVDEGAKHMGCLGMQVIPLFEKASAGPEHRESWLEVGMSIDVLERGHHVYIKQ